MSETMKESYQNARKAQRKCKAFKIAAIVTGAISVILGVIAVIMPPCWDVTPNVIKLIGEFMGIQCMFEVMVAFESGRDAKLVHGNTTVTLDGNGDGKMPE